MYEQSMDIIRRSLNGEQFSKQQLFCAWKIIDVDCKLSPKSGLKETSIFRLTGNKKPSEMTDEELLKAVSFQ